ncbi:hypothetical protein GJAV_G00086770, partial [Gymnothorax javanicus]
MMQAGVRLRQDTETTLPELPEQHRIREKEEELHGLESVHMAESETKLTPPVLNALEPEFVTVNSRVSDLHHTETSLIKTETDLSPNSTGDLKTESLDFTELAWVTHLHPDQIKTEADDGGYIKTECISVLPDIKCAYIKSDDMFESSEILGSDVMNTELNGAGADEKGQRELWQCAGEPDPNCRKSGEEQSELIQDVGILTGVKLYKCDQCEMGFTWKSQLKTHQTTHTREKPYRCGQCEKSFSRKDSLKCHQRIHTNEKPYRCDQLGKCFSSTSDLQSHEPIQNRIKPYKCDECQKCFLWKHSLTYHQRIHTGEEPYTCDQCGKCFK